MRKPRLPVLEGGVAVLNDHCSARDLAWTEQAVVDDPAGAVVRAGHHVGVQFVNEDGDIAVDGEIGAAFLTTVTGVSVTLHGTEGADVPLGYVVVLLKPLAPVTTCQLTDKSGSVMEDRTAPFRTAP